MVEGTATYVDENGTAVVGPPIVQCSAGGYHTLLLDLEGSAYACGDNSNGQLGVGAFHDSVEGKPGRSRRRCESRPTIIVRDANGDALPAMKSVAAGTVRGSLPGPPPSPAPN
jgi:alpha-tubulin suppressor-like RCC1 family protein